LSSRINGRHRAAVRAKTPLSTIAESVTANAGTVGRRTAVIAASSGLVVSMGVTAADASPMTGEPETASSTGAAKAGALLTVSTTALKAPADGKVTLASATVASVTPKPKPKPKPVVRPAASEQISRSAERAPLEVGTLSATRANILSIAARYVGTPYRYGGTTPSGFDCSGYTQYVFNQVGVSLPRTSSAQAAAGTRVSRSEALPGDLVWKPGHIGIYAGDNMMYHSPQTGDVVKLREIYSSEFVFIRVL
jgi:cell wall-associated NlpC family hydrolase